MFGNSLLKLCGGVSSTPLPENNLIVNMEFNNNINNEVVTGPIPYIVNGVAPQFSNNQLLGQNNTGTFSTVGFDNTFSDDYTFSFLYTPTDNINVYSLNIVGSIISINRNLSSTYGPSNKISFYYYSSIQHSSNFTLTNNDTIHISVVKDDNIIRLYINGAEDSVFSSLPGSTNHKILHDVSLSVSLNFLMDKFLVYDRALSPSEINNVYLYSQGN